MRSLQPASSLQPRARDEIPQSGSLREKLSSTRKNSRVPNSNLHVCASRLAVPHTTHTLLLGAGLAAMRGVKRRFTQTRAVSCVCTVYVRFFLTLTDGWLATQSRDTHRHTARTHTMCAWCARRRRPLPFASPARKRPGVRHRRPHVARPRCFPCARIIAFRFEPLCSQAAQHLESGLRQHPCDLDAISMRSRSSPRRARTAKPRVGLEALLASLCVRLRAVRRHGEPRQQHLLA